MIYYVCYPKMVDQWICKSFPNRLLAYNDAIEVALITEQSVPVVSLSKNGHWYIETISFTSERV